MFGFLVKKTFYDLWDNLFKIALINLGFLALFIAGILLPPLFNSLPPLSTALAALCLLCCCVYLSAASLCLKTLPDYGSLDFAALPRKLAAALPAGLLLGVLCFLDFFLAALAIPFYFSLGSFAGLLLGCFLLWIMLAAILVMQFYLPARARLDTKPGKIIKKCFLIFFDNTLFCILAGAASLAILAFSLPLFMLLPGPGGILLFLDEALRLRLLKYDWLEANPGRKKIPWDVLLADEREKAGNRSLKGLLFPWKD
ncbi:MAG: hypothetical protein LBK63_08170 [Treponema sp.]|jgi:hypothetical protein|nr:hypothetical protein [Treponema sp.]